MSSKSLQKYLRKYMSKDEVSKKKKGIVKAPIPIDQVNTKQGLCKIVDDDIDMKNIEGGNHDLMDLELGEDAPQIAGIVDERPVSIQAEERFGSYRWKSIADDSNETRNNAERNESPVRKTVRKEERSVKKTRNDSDSDQSVSRSSKNVRQRNDSDSDQSVSRSSKNVRQRNDSDSDQSVSRSSKNVHKRHDSDSDLSPPRKSDEILSKLQKNDFDLIDKRAIRQNSDSDLSPERNIDKSSMISGSEKKLGKIRVKNESDSDLSPPRIPRKSSDDVDELVVKKKGSNDRKKSETLDGKVAGLQKAADVRAEGERLKKREKEWLEKMDTSTSGRHAVAIVRDRTTGKKVNLVEKERREREKKAKQAEREAKYQKWGKGLKQIEETKEKLQNDLKEMEKPFARYANDVDLDKLRREQERYGDPMLKFLRKKRKIQNVEQGIVDKDDKPKYKGCAPPNRFKIRPGYRWDGVDRSNGFERDRFTRLANSQAQDVDIYKWSIEDM